MAMASDSDSIDERRSTILVDKWTKNEPSMYFSVVEELLRVDPAAATGRMRRNVWRHMPEDLVDRVLLFLPASRQARLAIVCKRWRALMSSVGFREQSALIAFRSTDSVCICSPEEPCDLLGDRLKNIKVVRFGMGMFPKELIPSLEKAEVLTHGGLLGLAVETYSPRGVAVFVFNPVNGTRRALPRVVFDPLPSEWEISLVAYEQTGYQVFLAWRGTSDRQTRFSVYSSFEESWKEGFLQPCAQLARHNADELPLGNYVVSKGGFVHMTTQTLHEDDEIKKVFRVTADGKYVRTLPEPPMADCDLKTQFSCLDASHDSETLYWVRNTCTILKCGSRSRMWKLVSRLPKSLRDKMKCKSSSKCELEKAKVVGDLILLVCIAPTVTGGQDKYVVAYHIVNESWSLVCQASYFWECHEFLAPKPDLVVG